jgi:hypothetical protein
VQGVKGVGAPVAGEKFHNTICLKKWPRRDPHRSVRTTILITCFLICIAPGVSPQILEDRRSSCQGNAPYFLCSRVRFAHTHHTIGPRTATPPSCFAHDTHYLHNRREILQLPKNRVYSTHNSLLWESLSFLVSSGPLPVPTWATGRRRWEEEWAFWIFFRE